MKFVNKLGGYLVCVHSAIYVVLSFNLTIMLALIGMKPSIDQMGYLLEYIAPPVAIYMCVLGLFICRYFYGDLYPIVVPNNSLIRITGGIPIVDKHFLQAIVSRDAAMRKAAGYLYAISKPVTYSMMGVLFAVMLLYVIKTN